MMTSTTLSRCRRITQTSAIMSNQLTRTNGTVNIICHLCCTLDLHIVMKLKDGLNMMEKFSIHSMFASGSSWRRANGPCSARAACHTWRETSCNSQSSSQQMGHLISLYRTWRVEYLRDNHLPPNLSYTGCAENNARGSSQSTQRPPILDTVSECCKGALAPTFSLFFRLSKTTTASMPIALRCWRRRGT